VIDINNLTLRAQKWPKHM